MKRHKPVLLEQKMLTVHCNTAKVFLSAFEHEECFTLHDQSSDETIVAGTQLQIILFTTSNFITIRSNNNEMTLCQLKSSDTF